MEPDRVWSCHANLQPNCWTERYDIEEWFLALTATGNKEAHLLAILTTWHVWKERNARVFNAKRSTEQEVMTRIKDEFADWYSAL